MSDYMREAERLPAEHEQAAGLCRYADCQTTRAALLAHIQRGAVPEGNERGEWEAVIFTLMGHAASLYFCWQSDMPNWFYELAEKLARLHVDEALAARVRKVGVQQRAMLAAAPAPGDCPNCFEGKSDMDHTCRACGGSGKAAAPAEVPMPEPVGWYVSGSDPEHAALWLDRPDDDQMQVMNQQCDDGPVVARPLVLGADAKRYGDARDAAGYARGLKEAGRDAERLDYIERNARGGEAVTTKHAGYPSFSEYTVCGLAFDAHESGDHDEPVLFAEDGAPVTCLKCREIVTEVRQIKLGRLPRGEVKP